MQSRWAAIADNLIPRIYYGMAERDVILGLHQRIYCPNSNPKQSAEFHYGHRDDP